MKTSYNTLMGVGEVQFPRKMVWNSLLGKCGGERF